MLNTGLESMVDCGTQLNEVLHKSVNKLNISCCIALYNP